MKKSEPLRGEIIAHQGRPFQDPDFHPGGRPRYDASVEEIFRRLRAMEKMEGRELEDALIDMILSRAEDAE